jgi:hypothetical protein
MTELRTDLGDGELLAQLGEIEDWSDYAARVLEAAKQQPSNVALRDWIAKQAEEDFINGSKSVFGIFARAAREAEVEARAEEITAALNAVEAETDPKIFSASPQPAAAKPAEAQPSSAEASDEAILAMLGIGPDAPQYFKTLKIAEARDKAQSEPKAPKTDKPEVAGDVEALGAELERKAEEKVRKFAKPTEAKAESGAATAPSSRSYRAAGTAERQSDWPNHPRR